MHPFRVGGSLTHSMGDTTVDEIMEIGAWKTRAAAGHDIGPTTSAPFGEGCSDLNLLPLSAPSHVISPRFAAYSL